MEVGKILVAATAKELDVTHCLGASLFYGEASVRVLDVVGCGNDIVGDLEELSVIPTVRAF
jgi:hypothetical protein